MNQLTNFIKQNSTVILAGVGVLGFCTAAYMAAKAAPSANRRMRELGEDADKMEKAKVLVISYAPTAGMLMLSAAFIVASTRLQQQRYAGLLALYSVSEKNLRRWQEAVVSELPKKKADQVRRKTVEPEGEIPSSLLVKSEGVLMYDQWGGRYFRAKSIDWVRSRINHANDFMRGEDFITLNEVYDCLDLPPVDSGQVAGFQVDEGAFFPIFDAFVFDEIEPCVSFTIDRRPIPYHAF